MAEGIGGGGRGGDATDNPGIGGGGKGGSYAKKTITKGTESSLTITVGAGGTSGSVNGTASTIVQDSTTVLSAAGGYGVAPNVATGATSLNGSNIGDTTYAGGDGGTGNSTGGGGGGGAAGPASAGGNGGVKTAGTAGTGTFENANTYQGAGGAGTNNAAGAPGSNYGGAGAGGETGNATDQLGGDGGAGIVVLTWEDASSATNLPQMLFT